MHKKILRILLTVILSVAGLLLLIAVLIYLPPVQRFIKNKALAAVSSSTGMAVTVENFRMRFPALLRLDNVTVVEEEGDTILRSRSVDARIALLPLVRSEVKARGIELQDTYINYSDSAGSVNIRGTVEGVAMPLVSVNLKQGGIDAGGLDIHGTDLFMRVGDSPEDQTPSDTARWHISLAAANLSDIRFGMDGTGGTLAVNMRRGAVGGVDVSLFRQTVDVEKIILDTARYSYSPPEATAGDSSPEDGSANGLPWSVTVASVELNDNTARYYRGDTTVRRSGFDPADIGLERLHLKVDSVYNRDSDIRLHLRELSFTESSGLTVRNASGGFAMDSVGLRLSDFVLDTDGSSVKAGASAGDGALQGSPDAPVQVRIEADMDADELLLFLPLDRQLANTLAGRQITLDGSAKGTLSRLDITQLETDIPGILILSAEGEVEHLDEPSRLGGNISFRGTTGNLAPLRTMIADTTLRNRINIPSGMNVYGKASFSPESYSPDITVRVDDGSLHLAGRLNTRAETYDIDLETTDFPLSRFLPRDSLGRATITLDATGNGFNPLHPGAAADISLVIDRFDYYNYPYSDITLKALLRDGSLNGTLHSGSRPLSADLSVEGSVRDSLLYGRVYGRVGNADLGALGLSASPLAVAGILDANLRVWPDTAYAASVSLDTVRINYGDGVQTFAHADISARAGEHGVAATAKSGDLDLDFMAAVPLDSIAARIRAAAEEFREQFAGRSLDMEQVQEVLPPLRLELHAGRNNLLHGLLLEQGYGFNRLDVSASTLDSEQFRAAVVAEGFQTSGLPLDTLNIWMRRNDKRLEYAVRLRNRPGNNDRMSLVRARGYVEDNRAELSMLQRDRQDSVGFRFTLDAQLLDSAVTVTINPENLIFGYRPWTVNAGNYFTYDFDRELYADIRLDGEGEHVHIVSTQLDGFPRGAVQVDLGGIDIAKTLGLFPSPPAAGGTLSTDLRFGMAGPAVAVEGNIEVDSASWNGRRIGDIAVTADLRTDSTGSRLNGVQMQVDGARVLTADGTLGKGITDIRAQLTALPLTAVNPFLPEDLLQLEGTAQGQMTIHSESGGMDLEGQLGFTGGGLTVPMVGTRFSLPSDYIVFRQGQVIFDRYDITAPNGQPLVIDGSLDISSLADPSANLSVQATNFEVVNSQRSAGSDVYGRALADIDVTATGQLNALRVRGDLSILTGTDVTYTVPDNNLELQERTQDIVTFISFADTAAVFAADSAALSKVWGMDMLVNVDIQDNVKATINLSADGNNRAELTGDGTLTYTMNSQGDSRFTGRYTLSGGTVVYNPPVTSAKTFTVNDGSYVEWTGDIADPTFNVTATESLRTIIESDNTSRSVTFDITVKIQNTLDNLALVFDLSAPGDLTIQNQLQSLSAEERSQQALALLIYNTYTGPGTTARVDTNNPLNSFIEKELNQWARNSLPGVDLSLGVTTVTDSDGGQHTDYSYRVSKSLFDDRVQVTVGGSLNPEAGTNENLKDNFVDDITLEYRLSNRDNMFLKAYRYNTQESILEGEITETGFGFVARKKLNKLKELFRLRRSPEQKALRRNRKEVKQQVRQAERTAGNDPAKQQRQDDAATLGNDEDETTDDRQAKPREDDGL